jgi:dTMP kinase
LPEKNEIGGSSEGTSRSCFIVLEGIDGSGTTTQLARLTNHLRGLGRRVHATREPSDGPVGRLIREILLGGHRGPDGAEVDGQAMALLFAADRRDHLRREIEPALAAGIDVVTDRYLLSSLAYQAEEAERDWVAGLARAVRPPDLTLLLDVSVSVAAARRHAAGRSTERYDEDGFQARVAANYRRLASGDPGIVVLDGSGSVDAVADAIAREVAKLMIAA